MKTTPTFSLMYNGWKPAWQSLILDCPFFILAALVLLLSSVAGTSAAVRYVDVNSASPMPPYTNWATAATTIQAAIDAAAAGDEVVVTNGVYATGGRAVVGTMTNRVTVGKAMTVRSVNGPQFTMIQGRQVSVTTNGDGAIRCVYLASGATLSGFTLTNGATRTEGYVEPEQSGAGLWCESTTAVVSNCVLAGNSASYNGGGAYRGSLNNCTLTGNSAYGGGGVSGGTLKNCTLTGNSADQGGGADSSTLNNCTLTGNSAQYGGGASWCALNNCIVSFNWAPQNANYAGSSLRYCCTSPLPDWGTGNISVDPLLADASHLSGASPCRGAGNAEFAMGADIDGEAWAGPPSIGCDEYHVGPVTGSLSLSVAAAFTNVAVDFSVDFTGSILGHAGSNSWDFGDGTIVHSQFYQPLASHSWSSAGDYAVVLRAYNGIHPGGVSATVTVHVVTAPVHYVSTGSTNPVPPYVSWGTAARTIQDAVDSVTVVGALVLVTNGVYQTGGRAAIDGDANRVAVDKPLTLRSVNGPEFTVICGKNTTRGVYLTIGAVLTGFTLTNGWAVSGGGIYCESPSAVVSNCVLVNNGANEGGGAYGGTLDNCTLIGNAAWGGNGGGVYGGTLNNCALEGNWTCLQTIETEGGGAYKSTLNNCTLTGNSAEMGNGGGTARSLLNNCQLIGNAAGLNGGGTYLGTLNNCTLTDNSATTGGGAGGFYHCSDLCFEGRPVLNNCTLNNNSAHDGGGAAWSTLNQCTLTGNRATGADWWNGGGGAWQSGLQNCTLTGNSAQYGGGAWLCALNNCTLTGNTATNSGGGASYGSLKNCIVYSNMASNGANYESQSTTLNYCCTTPPPTNGMGNITNSPLFVDFDGGNLRLQSNSPCINSGFNGYASAGLDLDGNPRLAGGTVDIGAFEFQSPASVISYAWLQQYGLPTDGSADYPDSDSDGLNNWQEWRAGTNPTNSLSVLKLLSPIRGVSGLTVSWQSVSGRNYFLERGTNLGVQPPFSTLATNIVGQPGTTTFTDTNAVGPGPFFYRLGLQ